MTRAELGSQAFQQLQQLFQEASGIELTPEKRLLVQTRLAPRVQALGLRSFDEYCRYLRNQQDGAERQRVVDLLTTNETYFFREPSHFEQLRKLLHTRFPTGMLRVWSAACSTGEEAYSIAMTMLESRSDASWQLVATDLLERVLEHARLGVFPMQRLEHMPPSYLKRYCLRGTKDYEGSLRISAEVRRRIEFRSHNLLHDPRVLGSFDIIFLRNVLIYFTHQRKQEVLARVLSALRPRGVLFTGHAEPLLELGAQVQPLAQAVFERAGS